MATFGLTIGATKIDLTSGTGTLAQLYTDAIADTPGCMTNPGGVYQVEGDREVEISSGVTLDIESDTLQWELAANKSTGAPNIDVTRGGTLNGGPGGQIIGDINSAYTAYFMIYGSTNLQGTSGNEFSFRRFTSLYRYFSYGETNDWDHVELWHYNNFYLGSATTLCPDYSTSWEFHDITCDCDSVPGTSYGFTMYNGDYSRVTLKRFTIRNCTRPIYNTGQAIALFQDFTISDYTHYCYQYYPVPSQGLTQHYATYYSDFSELSWAKRTQQGVAKHDGLSIDHGGGTHCFLVYVGSSIYFKNCAFTDVTYTSYTSSYVGQLVLWGPGNRFSGVTLPEGFSTTYRPRHLHVRELDLTLEDEGGNPLENAMVHIKQKQDKEEWTFYTDSLGRIDSGLGNPFFAFKEHSSTEGTHGWSSSDYWDFTPIEPGYNLYDNGWRVFEEGATTVGFNTDAAVTDPTATESGLKVVVTTNAQDGYVIRPVWDAPDAGETKTVEFWYQTAVSSGTSSNQRRLEVCNEDQTYVLRVYNYDAGETGGILRLWHASGTTDDYYPEAKRPPVGDWVHFKVEITRATVAGGGGMDGSASLYVDYNAGGGYELIAQVTGVDNFAEWSESSYMKLGVFDGTAQAGWTGYFDEVETSANDWKHTITVSKEGYRTQSQDIAMDRNQTVTMTLLPNVGVRPLNVRGDTL